MSKLFVEKQLKSLKHKKAAGFDKIPPGFDKVTASVIFGPLSFVINLCLTKGSVPKNWKIAKVIPMHKWRLRDDMSNNHPASILDNQLLHDQLLKYIEQNKILSESQFGERRSIWKNWQFYILRMRLVSKLAMKIW